MAQKFIPLEDAAKELGIAKERLTELRESGKVRGYRDGASWKFRSEDLSKLATELTAEGEGPGSDPALGAVDEPSDPSDSILVSDAEVGSSPGRPPSTVIGEKKGDKPGDSDLELSVTDEAAVSDIQLAEGASDVLAGDSGSNVLGPSETPPVPAGKFEDLDEIEIDLETESSKILSGVDLPKPGDDDEEELDLVSSGVLDASGTASGAGSEIQLADDEADDLVLSEGSGSDITLSASDSGINLVDPADSGIALDDLELDLAGSSVSSLELDEAEPEKLELEEEPEAAEEIKQDDDFLLTPLGDAPGDEDSSSQVIALDSESDIEESAAAILGDQPDETAVLEPVEEGASGPAVMVAPAGMAAMDMDAVARETEFPGSIIAFLILCLIVMAICGFMMLDLLRFMWSWDEPFSLNGTLIDALNFFD